jgi:hypothetical protein
VRNAYEIYSFATEYIEHHVLAFGEAIVAFADIRPLFSQLWIFQKLFKTGFKAFQIQVSLCFCPSEFGIAANVH